MLGLAEIWWACAFLLPKGQCFPLRDKDIVLTLNNSKAMKKIVFLLLLLCSLAAGAQDVIIKKDGSTVVCRVVEVTKTEVIYKKWTDQQGSNYVVNQSDLSAIHYEDGTKKVFDNTVAETILPPVADKQMDDAGLIELYDTLGSKTPEQIQKKIKRLKRVGWIGGAACVAVGAVLLGPGAVLLAGGVALTSGCLIRAHTLKNSLKSQSEYSVNASSLYRQEFRLKNGSSLATGIDLLQDRTHRNPTLGIGLSYNF